MADKCTDLPASGTEVIALAIELVGYEAKNGPQQVAKVLQSPAIKKALEDALSKRMDDWRREMLTGNPTDVQQALSDVGAIFSKDVLSASTKELKKQVEQTSKYRKLASSVQNLSCKFKESPVGFFIHEPSNLVIVLAAGAMIAGSAAVYVAATGDGDGLAKLAGDLAGDNIKYSFLGKVDIGVKDIVIKPSEHKADFKIFADTSKWKSIPETSLTLNVQWKQEKVAALDVAVATKVPIVDGFFATGGAKFDPASKNTNLYLGIQGGAEGLSVQLKGEYDLSDKGESIKVGGGLTYQGGTNSSAPWELTAGAKYGPITQRQPDYFGGPSGGEITRNEARVDVGLKIYFDKPKKK